MSDFEIIFTYREIKQDTLLVPFDSKDIICGLVMLGVNPVHALSNGFKTKVAFVATEAEPVVLAMQKFILQMEGFEDLPTTYRKVLDSDRFWRDLMSLHDTYKIRLNSSQKAHVRV